MQERKTMSVYVEDQERLKPYFEPGKSWADALKNALNELDDLKNMKESKED